MNRNILLQLLHRTAGSFLESSVASDLARGDERVDVVRALEGVHGLEIDELFAHVIVRHQSVAAHHFARHLQHLTCPLCAVTLRMTRVKLDIARDRDVPWRVTLCRWRLDRWRGSWIDTCRSACRTVLTRAT